MEERDSFVKFETSKKKYFGLIPFLKFTTFIPSKVFYTFWKWNIYLTTTHIEGPPPGIFTVKSNRIIIPNMDNIELKTHRAIPIPLVNEHQRLTSIFPFPIRFPFPGIFFIELTIRSSGGINIIPFERDRDEEIKYLEVKKSRKNQVRLPIIVLDFFSLIMTILTGIILVLTIVLLFRKP